MKAYKIIVRGVVQGVGFRYFTKQQADSLVVQGTVQNLMDGSVRIHVQGSDKAVHDFLSWCHKGPPSATVTELDYKELESKAFKSFEILR